MSEKIRLIGKERDQADDWSLLSFYHLPSGNEAADRLKIMDMITGKHLRCAILYDGNTVWDHGRLVRDFTRVCKKGVTSGMTNYLYDFFSLKCGTIAHYDKAGWCDVYPDVAALKRLFAQNEYGQSVLAHQPHWSTDSIAIVKTMLTILAEYPN